jgi:MFS family permease
VSDSPGSPPILTNEPPDDQRPASSSPPLTPHLTPRPDLRDPYAALRFRDFRLYNLGWIIAVIGEQILEVAVGWDLYQRTHNAMTLGWVGLVSAIPVIALALPAGHLADHLDRRRIVLVMRVTWGLCALALAWEAHVAGPIPFIYGMLFVAAVAKATGGAARSAMLPSLVPPEYFPNAINWNSSGFQTAAMTGPALGGFILIFSSTAAYLVSAACAIAFAVALLMMNTPGNVVSREPATLKSLAAGVRFVARTRIVLAIITLDLFAVLLGGATYLLPVFAKDILHIGSFGFGALRAAPALGAVSMGILVAYLPPMKRAGRALLWSVATFGVATIVFGLSRSVGLSLVMLFFTGAFDNISVIVRHTLVQVLTPDSMRGRVSAVNNVFIGASNELGGFESGLTARLFGPITSVVGGGIGTILVVIAVALIWPEVMKFGSLVDARPMEELKTGFEVVVPPGKAGE